MDSPFQSLLAKLALAKSFARGSHQREIKIFNHQGSQFSP